MVKPSNSPETKVTRIKASTSASATTPKATSAKTDTKKVKGERTGESKNIFVRMGRYFKGAWVELRQVRWPDRKNTWAMTGALIAFTLFFIIVILFLDFLFSELFKLILGSN